MPLRRAAALDKARQRRGVLLTTYGMVLHNAEELGSARRRGGLAFGDGADDDDDDDDKCSWDVMFLDEVDSPPRPCIRMQLLKLALPSQHDVPHQSDNHWQQLYANPVVCWTQRARSSLTWVSELHPCVCRGIS